MHHAEVKIILDSISPQDIRLTTFQLRYWRPIHSELMTHRVFSRNAGSSRARPSQAIINQVRNDPWGPLHWGKNQPGMQAFEELSPEEIEEEKHQWRLDAICAAVIAQGKLDRGLHKQIVNRQLEPFTYIDVLVTSTQYANWFALRDEKGADPMIQDLAHRMRIEYDMSKPQLLQPGEWHLPYIEIQDFYDVRDYLVKQHNIRSEPNEKQILEVLKKVSTARSARISYAPFDGNGDIEKEIARHDALVVSQPVHASPAEHQATPDTMKFIPQGTDEEWQNYIAALKAGQHGKIGFQRVFENTHLAGNLMPGWIQYRKTLKNEFVPG